MQNKDSIKHLSIQSETNISQILQKITVSGRRELLVLDNGMKLVGTVSDGDIRKYLLKSNNLKIHVKMIMNKNPKFFYVDNIKVDKLFQYFSKNISLIPILNYKKEIITVLENSNYMEKLNQIITDKNIVVVMAGGKGTRLHPFTKVMPKALFPINKSTLIEQILLRFIKKNFYNFILIVNHQKELIKNYIKINKFNFPVKIHEEKNPLGTVGSLSNIKLISGQRIILVNCDTIFNFEFNDLLRFHIRKKSEFTIVISENSFHSSYGVCDIDKSNKLIGFREKPKISNNVNVGFYIIEKNIINLIPKNKFFGIDELINKVLKKGIKVYVYKIQDKNYTDYGKWEDIERSLPFYEKAVIIGYGSIGEKHYRSLKNIKYFDQIYVFSREDLIKNFL